MSTSSMESFPQEVGAEKSVGNSVKTKISFVLTGISFILQLVGGIIVARAMKSVSMDSLESISSSLGDLENAENTLFIFVMVASLLALVAFILAIIAIVKSEPKNIAVIALVASVVVPAIGFFIARFIQDQALDTVMGAMM